MSTSNSPLWKLHEEAKKAAHRVKVMAISWKKPTLKFGVVMNDKIITIEIARTTLSEMTEEQLEAMIVREMRGEKLQ